MLKLLMHMRNNKTIRAFTPKMWKVLKCYFIAQNTKTCSTSKVSNLKSFRTCYNSKVLQLTLYCSRLLYFFTIIFSFLHSLSLQVSLSFSPSASLTIFLFFFFKLYFVVLLPLISLFSLSTQAILLGETVAHEASLDYGVWFLVFFFFFNNLRLWSK